MNTMHFVMLCVCGGFGACARYMIEGLIASRLSSAVPWGTILINLSGSFLLGLLTGLVSQHLLPQAWQLVIGTGFLGGYTTFSTASFQTVSLLRDGYPKASLFNAFGTLCGALAAAGLGLLVASWW